MYTTIIATVSGSIIGYLYFKFVGCRSGACPMTSTPLGSILYGALLGYMAADFFR